ncbi:hypothetical protein BH11CYA1_BH11CYA1_44050 [soil metagenome]
MKLHLPLRLNLARLDFENGHLDKAIANIDAALKQYQIEGKKVENFAPILYTRGKTKSEGICEQLCKAGRASDVERLLKDAVQASKKVYGVGSYDETISLGELAGFYATEKQDKLLDDVTADMLRSYEARGALPPNYSGNSRDAAMMHFLEVSVLLAEQGNSQKGIEMDTKLLTLQRKMLKSYSDQIADTLVALGTIYTLTNKFQQAEPLFCEALKIKKGFLGQSRPAFYFMGLYADVLRKLGREDEANQIMTIGAPGTAKSHGLPQADKSNFTATKSNITGKIDRVRDELVEALRAAQADAPYGTSASKILFELASYDVRENHNKLAELEYLELLEMADAGSPSLSGGRKKLLLALAELYIKEGDNVKAAKAIDQAKKSDSGIFKGRRSVRDTIKYAELEIEANNYKRAIEDLELVEHLIAEDNTDSSRPLQTLFTQLAALWRKLGNDEKANAAAAKAEALKRDVSRIHLNRQRPSSQKADADLSSPSSPPPSPPTHPGGPSGGGRLPSAHNPINNSDAAYVGAYMADLERRIRRAWFPPRDHADKVVQTTFMIKRGGDVSNIELSRSSGNPLADRAALRAIEKAAPFRPLPPGSHDTEKFEYTFNYPGASSNGNSALRRLQ